MSGQKVQTGNVFVQMSFLKWNRASSFFFLFLFFPQASVEIAFVVEGWNRVTSKTPAFRLLMRFHPSAMKSRGRHDRPAHRGARHQEIQSLSSNGAASLSLPLKPETKIEGKKEVFLRTCSGSSPQTRYTPGQEGGARAARGRLRDITLLVKQLEQNVAKDVEIYTFASTSVRF